MLCNVFTPSMNMEIGIKLKLISWVMCKSLSLRFVLKFMFLVKHEPLISLSWPVDENE